MSQAQPPRELRPWYYKNPALFPAFLLGWPIWPPDFPMLALWPAWAILIIRSPWHRGFITGTVAWAMLMTGGWIVALRILDSRTSVILIVVTLAPGLIYTVVTQTLWAKSKQEILASIPAEPAAPVVDNRPRRSQRERLRRRQSRRASRPGRTSRHPF